MLSFADYAAHDAVGLMALLARGEVSAQELHDTALAALKALNPQLGAVVTRSPADAAQAVMAAAQAPMGDAQALGAGRAGRSGDARGPFAGLPFLVKDGVGMRGQRTVLGCRLAEPLRCDADSELVRRLRRAGVVILGSTNAPEMGLSPTCEPVLHGPARNPWNLLHSTGGSSGGSAAAVAAAIVPVAQSSDGAGSIRTPAHCCGTFGLKPSRGRNPVGPNSFGGPFGLGCQHVDSRTVRDSAAFLDALHGAETGAHYRADPPSRPFAQEVGAAPGRLRIAFSAGSPSGMPVHPEVAAAVHAAARLCESLGHHVEDAAPALDWEVFSDVFSDVFLGGWPAAIAQLEAATGLKAGPDTLERSSLVALEYARGISLERFVRSSTALFRIGRETEAFFADWDLHLCPVNLVPARPLGTLDPQAPWTDFREWFDVACSQLCPHTPIFNVTGQPAMSVPFALSSTGLPIGIQFVARPGDEATLLRVAAQIEAARPWIQRRPPVHAGRLA